MTGTRAEQPLTSVISGKTLLAIGWLAVAP